MATVKEISFGDLLFNLHKVSKENAQEKHGDIEIFNSAFEENSGKFNGSGEHAIFAVLKDQDQVLGPNENFDQFKDTFTVYLQSFMRDTFEDQLQDNDLQPIVKMDSDQQQNQQQQTNGQQQNQQTNNGQNGTQSTPQQQTQQGSSQQTVAPTNESSRFPYKRFHMSLTESLIDTIFEADQQQTNQQQQQNQQGNQSVQSQQNKKNIRGYMVYYRIDVDGSGGKTDFTQILKNKAKGIFGNTISDLFSLKINWRGKSLNVGKLLDPEFYASLAGKQDIDSGEVASLLTKAFQSEDTHTTVICQCYSINGLTNVLKRQKRLSEEDLRKFNKSGATYAVTATFPYGDVLYDTNMDKMLKRVKTACDKAFGSSQKLINGNSINQKDIIVIDKFDPGRDASLKRRINRLMNTGRSNGQNGNSISTQSNSGQSRQRTNESLFLNETSSGSETSVTQNQSSNSQTYYQYLKEQVSQQPLQQYSLTENDYGVIPKDEYYSDFGSTINDESFMNNLIDGLDVIYLNIPYNGSDNIQETIISKLYNDIGLILEEDDNKNTNNKENDDQTKVYNDALLAIRNVVYKTISASGSNIDRNSIKISPVIKRVQAQQTNNYTYTAESIDNNNSLETILNEVDQNVGTVFYVAVSDPIQAHNNQKNSNNNNNSQFVTFIIPHKRIKDNVHNVTTTDKEGVSTSKRDTNYGNYK